MLRGAVNLIKKSVGLPGEQKALSLSDPDIGSIFGYVPTASGVSVTADTALRVPAVLQAVRLIAEAIGTTSCKLYVNIDDSKETAKDHRAYKLVHDRANGWTSAGQLRTELTFDAMLHGAGYAHVRRLSDGTPYEIHRLKPGSVQRRTEEDGEPYFVVTTKDRRQVVLPYADVIYVPGFVGGSLVSLGREAIAVAMNLEKHAAEFFGSGARPAIAVTAARATDEKVGASVTANTKKLFKKAMAEDRIVVLEGGSSVDVLTMTSSDAQFLENRRFQTEEIARVFGVPPTMLFDLVRGTWSNTEEMNRNFRQVCLKPWFERWQTAYAMCLLSEDDLETHYVEFIPDDMQNTDISVRTDTLTKLIAARVMTPNEARGKLNMPALPGGDELVNPHITPAPAAAQPADKEPKE